MFVGVRALLICRRQSPQSRSTPAAGNGWRAGLGRHFDASLTRAARVDASCWRWSVGDATNIAPSLRHYRKIWYRSHGQTLRRHRVSWVSSILRRRPGAVNPASHGAGALTIVMPRFQIRPSRYGKAHIAGAAPSIQGSQRMWPLAVLADTGKSRI